MFVFTIFAILGYRLEEETSDPWQGGATLILGTILAFATAAVLG